MLRKNYAKARINRLLDAYKVPPFYITLTRVLSELKYKNSLFDMAFCQEIFITYYRNHNESFDKLINVDHPLEMPYWFTFDTSISFCEQIHAVRLLQAV